MPVAVALVLIAGCGDSGGSGPEPEPDPIPGWLKVRLDTPNADDGGIMFTVSGGAIESVRSSFLDLYVSQGSSTLKRIIVAGNLPNGTVLVELKVPDVQDAEDYSAIVDQVASGDSFVQRTASGYSLSVER
jgi:hypothetical protein